MTHLTDEKKKFLTTYFIAEIDKLKEAIDLDHVIKEKEFESNNLGYFSSDYFLDRIDALIDEYQMVVHEGVESGYPSIDMFNERDIQI